MEVTLSELRANTATVVERVDRNEEPAVITRRGKAVAFLVPRVQALADTNELTTEEWDAVRAGVMESRAEIRAGLGVSLEEAKRILRAKWGKKNGKTRRR